MVAQLQVGVEPVCAPTLSIRDQPAATAVLRQPEPVVFDDEGAAVIVDEHQCEGGDASPILSEGHVNDVSARTADPIGLLEQMSGSIGGPTMIARLLSRYAWRPGEPVSRWPVAVMMLAACC